ncbi:unnamed protein product, partial [Meganyctiphanes norvegica]
TPGNFWETEWRLIRKKKKRKVHIGCQKIIFDKKMPGKSPIVTPIQVQSNSIICSTCGAQLNSFECGVKCRACQSWFHPHPCSNVTVDMLEAIQMSGLNDVAHWFCQDCEGMLTEACTSL